MGLAVGTVPISPCAAELCSFERQAAEKIPQSPKNQKKKQATKIWLYLKQNFEINFASTHTAIPVYTQSTESRAAASRL